ncbi:sensor histidine kinase [Sphingomicrobium sp. XHP0239]|uniref:sensor histidine kinase n=1 Tax=Sphingomicrobium maritimum TaxID=3133972 RepID=UPI0031CC84E3
MTDQGKLRLARPARQTPRGLGKQVALGALCAGVMIGLRELINLWAPTSGPFAMIFPTIMIATLYGRWRAGLTAFVITFLYAWWAVLPFQYSLVFENPGEGPRVLINAVAGLVIMVFAEAFRDAVERASAQRDEEIERREVAMLELGHRTKNNFALVASLLEIQKRREESPDVRATLDTAIGRVHSFAEAYAHFSEDTEGGSLDVAMRPYLESLMDMLGTALFDDRVALRGEIADIRLPKEKAVALGLVLNEALTNAAKYAFPGGRKGEVVIRLSGDPSGWDFAVDDDGVGRQETAAPQGSGLGAGLMDAFARQADAQMEVESLAKGTRLRLRAAMV